MTTITQTTTALDLYAGIHALHTAAEKQPPTHGAALTVFVDHLDAATAQRVIELCAEGVGINGSGSNGQPGGSTVSSDPLGGFSVHLAAGRLRVTLGVTDASGVQRSVIENMVRLLSCGWCGTALSLDDYRHDAGELCKECRWSLHEDGTLGEPETGFDD
jgi:hypothetical protein